MPPRNNILSSRKRTGQKGSALIIGMIIVLMLTLLGVTTLRTTALEARMAGNERDTHVGFESAEGALREMASKNLSPLTIDYSGSLSGYGPWKLSYADALNNPTTEYNYWTSIFGWSSGGLATQATGSKEAARYFVDTKSFLSPNSNKKSVRVFRITVNGVGASSNARIIVQGTTTQEIN
jgi:type IV pilus assembly protein PilX